ncbi:CBS domain-containing protein [Candidatus Desulforudis audaxviator]|uniref:Diguanylate cyclase n=1 Tax=Desulforudis audaxviator (strain MP104C) TaxID=477974 RepID=B1I2X0_DESAP|nr:CBS domain-containing protein [Candidatus Desulforudis audaxviator]ACA59337.1 diguanylate cyclase [Candidatus Desulforudis audaxviator MP104C]AZK59310.1 Diguanylate cyclase [Candidatus Desulforudis audaxviator]
MRVQDIMSQSLVTVSSDRSVRAAIELMHRMRIGSLPVVDDGWLVGIVTSRDVRGAHPNRLVADVMRVDVVTVSAESSLWEAKELLERHGIERLVVVERDSPVGIVTKSRLYAEIGKHVDGLTGLERAEFLQRKAAELLKQDQEIAVIFLDLDDFGVIDKEYGHVFGDEILMLVAKTLKELLADEGECLCRYAGDEFAVVTTAPLDEAKQLALRMVTALRTKNWPRGVKVTGSAGVAGGRRQLGRQTGNEIHTVSDLINMASLASTAAKKDKKQVVVAGKVELTEEVP